ERRDLPRPALQVVVVFLLDGSQTTDAGAAHRPAAIRVELVEVDSGVGDRLDARSHSVLHEFIHAPRILGRDVLGDIEVTDRAAEANGKGGHVEFGDRPDTALSPDDGIPGDLDVAADRRNDAEACDDDATLAHTLPV